MGTDRWTSGAGLGQSTGAEGRGGGNYLALVFAAHQLKFWILWTEGWAHDGISSSTSGFIEIFSYSNTFASSPNAISFHGRTAFPISLIGCIEAPKASNTASGYACCLDPLL